MLPKLERRPLQCTVTYSPQRSEDDVDGARFRRHLHYLFGGFVGHVLVAADVEAEGWVGAEAFG